MVETYLYARRIQSTYDEIESPRSSGLFDCFSDCSTCCCTFWCPCITFGQIADIVDKGNRSCCVSGALYCVVFTLTGCACCYSCCYRIKMRQQFMLKKSPCDECLVHFFCGPCALCQERREIKSHGFDTSLVPNYFSQILSLTWIYGRLC
ncbi:hypothetical protein Pint_22355 [Pistacia integerrima]|uniref:Uncharacterized protein n=1 Tax=Pistacia integerrima TaxID=434235 RepID=A0ACC0YHV3_9ROSI|nr:hypothetical protein Pint_22355 [Pistacia integerrima]